MLAMQKTVRKFRWITSTALLCCVVAIAAEGKPGEGAKKPVNPARFGYAELLQSPPTSVDQQQRDNFAALTEALANESFSEAEIAAKQMVELVTADATDESSARARALHNLAVVQQFQGSSESALQNYSAALGIIVSNNDNLSPSLITPLRGLAFAHLDLGQSQEAFQMFDRALHVSNVNYGPHSFEQLPILNSKLQIYLQQRDPESALDMLDRIHTLYWRKYPKNSEELLPVYYQQARVYGKLNMHAAAFNAWRHILLVRQKHLDKNDLALIEPHIRMAEVSTRGLRNDFHRSVTTSTAEKHLKKALWIAENSPVDDWKAKKKCLLSLADFYTLFDLKGRARRYYSAAWELLSSNEDYRTARAENLEVPVPLVRTPPYPYANFEYDPNRDQVDPNDYLEGEMVMTFTINARGRTEDHRLVAADPANFSPMERRVRNSVEDFIYRPRYVDGRPVATHDQRYRARYYYVPSEYQASIEKSARRGPN